MLPPIEDDCDVVKNFEVFMKSSPKALQMADELVAVDSLDKEQFQNYLEKYFENVTESQVCFFIYLYGALIFLN